MTRSAAVSRHVAWRDFFIVTGIIMFCSGLVTGWVADSNRHSSNLQATKRLTRMTTTLVACSALSAMTANFGHYAASIQAAHERE
jgi:site-specific recombinase